MDKILEQKIFDNELSAILYVIAVIGLVFFLKRIISRYLAQQLYKLVAKASKNIPRQSFFDLVVDPLGFFLVVSVSIIAIDKLTFPSALDFAIYRFTFRQLLDSVANGAGITVFIWLCLRIIDFVAIILENKANLTEDQSDNQLIVFFKDFFKAILIVIGILLLLRFSFNKNIGNLLTGLSIVGAAIALATRESLENLIASFIIFFDKPFITGDLVKVNGFTGTIEKIGLRSTRIRTTDKTYISVPNKQMVDTILDNITLRTQRKGEMKLELSLGVQAEQLKTLSMAVKKILNRPMIETSTVFLSETGKNAHIFTIEYFTSIHQTLEAFNEMREEINIEIIEFLEQNKIEMAAASTDVVIVQK